MDRPTGGGQGTAKAEAQQELDADALRRTARGDLAHFDSLVDRYQQRLYRHIRRRVNDPHRAEDLTQEVFLRLFRAARANQYNGQASVATWLFTIAGNCVNDYLRAEMRRDGDPPRKSAYRIESTADPGAVAQEREGEAQMRQMLHELPAEQREVIELHVLDGLSFGEVAELVGCPIPTAKSRLVYGLRKIRNALAAARRRHES